jgi:hypothetical protein
MACTHGGDNVLDCSRKDNANRNLPIIGRLGSVSRSRARIEPDLCIRRLSELALQGKKFVEVWACGGRFRIHVVAKTGKSDEATSPRGPARLPGSLVSFQITTRHNAEVFLLKVGSRPSIFAKSVQRHGNLNLKSDFGVLEGDVQKLLNSLKAIAHCADVDAQ